MKKKNLVKLIILTVLLILLQVNLIATANNSPKVIPAVGVNEPVVSENPEPQQLEEALLSSASSSSVNPSSEHGISENPEPQKPEEELISSASSSTANCTPGILTNIKLASDKVNSFIIQPGEEFSFNQVVGERTPEAGYMEGRMIVDDQPVLGTGGGICQLSSMIYDAASDAGLEIVERNPHTLPVSYAAPGRDAMVAYGQSDLIIKDNKEEPIKIVSAVTETELSVSLYLS